MSPTPDSAIFSQDGYAVRFEWGTAGARALAPWVDVLVIVDVLSFTTAVDVAVTRGAQVYPYRQRDASAVAFAQRIGAVLAVDRRAVSAARPYSLSPVSLVHIPIGTRLVLPSPNGATISVLAAELGRPALAGCLRNATSVATAASRLGRVVGVVGSGERWSDGTLRPAYEDLVGAGAILAALRVGSISPEAHAAIDAFRAAHRQLQELLLGCTSGRELAEAGYAADVRIASELDVSTAVPLLRSGAYVSA